MLEIVSLTPEGEGAYARFVFDHPAALISYSLTYRDFLVEVLGCDARYAVAPRDGNVVDVLPVMSIDGSMGVVLNSLPYFGSNGGVLAVESEAHAALLRWYSEQARGEEVLTATIVANPLASGRPKPPSDVVDLRVGHVTDLTNGGEPEARVWNAIDGSARRNIKKAERLGTCVSIENTNFDDLGKLHQRSMRAIGAFIKAPQFFGAVQAHFRPSVDYDLYIGRIEGRPVAVPLTFYCGGSVDYYDPDDHIAQPMAAVLFAAMVEAAKRGYVRWNWGANWPAHVSLQRFKAKWGGVASEYQYATKINDARVLHEKPESAPGCLSWLLRSPFSTLEEPPRTRRSEQTFGFERFALT